MKKKKSKERDGQGSIYVETPATHSYDVQLTLNIRLISWALCKKPYLPILSLHKQ